MRSFARCFAVAEALLVCLPSLVWWAALHIDWGFPKGRVLMKFSPYFAPPAALARGAFGPVGGVPMPHGLVGWSAVIITYTAVAATVALIVVGIAKVVRQTEPQNQPSQAPLHSAPDPQRRG